MSLDSATILGLFAVISVTGGRLCYTHMNLANESILEVLAIIPTTSGKVCCAHI